MDEHVCSRFIGYFLSDFCDLDSIKLHHEEISYWKHFTKNKGGIKETPSEKFLNV